MNVGKKSLRYYLSDVVALMRSFVYTSNDIEAERLLLRLESAICAGSQMDVFRTYPGHIQFEPECYRGCGIYGTWDLKGFLDRLRDWWHNPYTHLQSDIPAVIQLREETRRSQVDMAIRSEIERSLSDKARKALGFKEVANE